VIHDMHLFEVKSPEQSKGAWDYYTHKRTVPAAESFRPIAKGGCGFAQG
jgi:branched-chain amino acid transport system substrate-binding protein